MRKVLFTESQMKKILESEGLDSGLAAGGGYLDPDDGAEESTVASGKEVFVDPTNAVRGGNVVIGDKIARSKKPGNGRYGFNNRSSYSAIQEDIDNEKFIYNKFQKNAAAATGTNNWQSEPSINLSNNKSGWTGTNLCVVYLVGTLDGTIFTIDSTMLTTTVPTSADNKVYTPLGVMYSTTNCYFRPTNEYYAYVNGKFQKLTYVHPTTAGNKHIPSGGSSGQYLKWSADGTATWATISIPTITDTYSATSSNGMSGKAVAAALATLSDNDTKNTAGTTNKTGTKMFLAGATSQAANPQTYSNSNVFIDAANTLNCVTPATTLDGDTAANKTKVATVGTVSAMIDALCTQLDAQTTNWS